MFFFALLPLFLLVDRIVEMTFRMLLELGAIKPAAVAVHRSRYLQDPKPLLQRVFAHFTAYIGSLKHLFWRIVAVVLEYGDGLFC